MQAVEADCATLGALLKTMLGLLSKPQAAADLFSCELHAQAGTCPVDPPAGPPAAPQAATLLGTASDSKSPHLQAAAALHASGTGAAEVVNADSFLQGSIPQPASVQTHAVTGQEVHFVAAPYAASKEADRPKYENDVRRSSREAAGAAQGVPKAASGSGNGPGLVQSRGSESQLQQNTVLDVLKTEERAAVPLASQSVTAGEGKDAHLESQAPDDKPEGSLQGRAHPVTGHPNLGKRQAVSAGVPADTVAEQASAQRHDAPHTMNIALAQQQQQPQDPSQPAGTAGQQGTAASSQLVATGVRVGSGVEAGTTASAGAGMAAGSARTGSMAGKGGKHKGGGRGSMGQEVGMRLTGSAAQALAVLQAGMSSKPARAEDNAGAYMPLLH